VVLVEVGLQKCFQRLRSYGLGEIVVHAAVQAPLAIAFDGGGRHGDDEHVPNLGVRVLAYESGC